MDRKSINYCIPCHCPLGFLTGEAPITMYVDRRSFRQKLVQETCWPRKFTERNRLPRKKVEVHGRSIPYLSRYGVNSGQPGSPMSAREG